MCQERSFKSERKFRFESHGVMCSLDDLIPGGPRALTQDNLAATAAGTAGGFLLADRIERRGHR